VRNACNTCNGVLGFRTDSALVSKKIQGMGIA
jgi:hypothetical protein